MNKTTYDGIDCQTTYDGIDCQNFHSENLILENPAKHCLLILDLL